MATIRMNLSSKQQKEGAKHEILLRISIARNKVFRVKSNLFILPKYWDTKKEKNHNTPHTCKRARGIDCFAKATRCFMYLYFG